MALIYYIWLLSIYMNIISNLKNYPRYEIIVTVITFLMHPSPTHICSSDAGLRDNLIHRLHIHFSHLVIGMS